MNDSQPTGSNVLPVVFIESINKKKGYLLLDFPVTLEGQIDQYSAFLSQAGLDNNAKGTSMLEVTGIKFAKYGTPREGLYYRLPTKLVEANWTQEPTTLLDDEELETNVIAYYFDASDDDPIEFENAENYTLTHKALEDNRAEFKEQIDRLSDLSSNCSEIMVVVHNVGQGNFNQTFFDSGLLLNFDLGGQKKKNIRDIVKTHMSDMRHIRIDKILEPDKPKTTSEEIKTRMKGWPKTFETKFNVLIISHWDKDHYNGLLSVPQEFLNSLNLIFVPNILPNKTSERAYLRLPNNRVCIVKMRRSEDNTRLELAPLINSEKLIIYRGSRHYNRNKTGLSASVHHQGHDAIFPADLDYSQVNRYHIANCNKQKLVAVIPHHGGEAGDFTKIGGWNSLENAIISVGTHRSYDHPLPEVVNEILNHPNEPYLHNTKEEYIGWKKRLI